MSSLYIKDSLALLDYTAQYYDTAEEFLSSDEFKLFISHYLKHLKAHYHELYGWLVDNSTEDDGHLDDFLIKMLKLLTVLSFDDSVRLNEEDRPILLEIVERGYNFWRNMHRYSIVRSSSSSGLLLSNFMDADERFNHMVLSLYRMIQEKLQGSRNNIYRQLQAGTNACLLLYQHDFGFEGRFKQLSTVPVVRKVMMRSPIIIHLKHNKRIGTFTETKIHPLNEIRDWSDFICFPIYVGNSLTFVYFHKNFTASAIGLANLFEFANVDMKNTKPDCIILFGVEDEKDDTTYYFDEDQQIYIGKISYSPIIEYFGYFKKMALTLHNLAMIKKGYLPIHGAMLNIYLEDGSHKGVCLMGDSGAGKSETIEALNRIADEIERQDLIFDDMGTMYINDKGEVVCIGTEIGAFVRLDDLDAASAYKDLDRSIFFNPGNTNSRVITPASTYDLITSEHKVDIFLYANNYDDKRGLHIFDNVEEAKPVFLEGKRMALGTTNEVGYSTTYFANPFGPMQEKEVCDEIIDKTFKKIKENGVMLGEIYTNLGLPNKGDGGIEVAARALLELIKSKGSK